MTAFLTVDEAADQLRVHPATIRRMIKRGEMPAVRVGRLWRVDASVTTAQMIPQAEKAEVVKYSAAYYVQLAQPRPSALASPAPSPDRGGRSGQAGWRD